MACYLRCILCEEIYGQAIWNFIIRVFFCCQISTIGQEFPRLLRGACGMSCSSPTLSGCQYDLALKISTDVLEIFSCETLKYKSKISSVARRRVVERGVRLNHSIFHHYSDHNLSYAEEI